MLYLVSTPIGNLGDITLRALETLKSCDYILCEDTRHSRKLLTSHAISKPLKSYHRFNEKFKIEKILEDLEKGLNIALISDAGTPTLCDPGFELVAACYTRSLSVTALPGPSALITALSLSGIAPLPFQFIGFLPKKLQELTTTLKNALAYPGTSLAYETPHHIEKTLTVLASLCKGHSLILLRELTKMYEERLQGTPGELLLHLKEHPPRGELVLIFPPYQEEADEELSLLEEVTLLQSKKDLSVNEAIKEVAKRRKISKRTVYNAVHR